MSSREANEQKGRMWLRLHHQQDMLQLQKACPNHCQRNEREVPHTWVQSDSGHKASGWPRDRFPTDPSPHIWQGHCHYLWHDWKAWWLNEKWEDARQVEPNFHPTQRISIMLHSFSNWWNLAPRSMISDVSPAHLCWSTSTNGSWSRRKQKNLCCPKLIRTTGQRIWRT